MIQQAKLPTDISRSKEVEALCRLHGYTKKRALEVVGLDPRRFGNVTRGKIDYLPTPGDGSRMMTWSCQRGCIRVDGKDDPEALAIRNRGWKIYHTRYSQRALW